MGLILMVYIGAGLIAGLLAGIPCLGVGIALLVRRGRTHERIWPMAIVGFVVGMIVAIGIVQNLPLKPVRPGSDYDIAGFNLLVTTFGYTLAPGVAMLVGAIFTRFSTPRTVVVSGQVLDSDPRA